MIPSPFAVVQWDSVLIGACVSVVIGGVLRALWRRGSGAFVDRLMRRHGEIRGEWFAILPEFVDREGNAQVERIDHMVIRQRGQRLFGQIRRVRPRSDDGKERRWQLYGYTHGNTVVCLFYTLSPQSDPTSYGAINVHRDPARRDVYRGFYTRPDYDPYKNFTEKGLARRPIVWQRPDPNDRRC